MIILKNGKFISGAKIFSAGAILPDNVDTQKLVSQGLAEFIADIPKKAVKQARIIEPKTVENTRENEQSNS